MSYQLLSDLDVEGNKNDLVGVAPYLVVDHSILNSYVQVEFYIYGGILAFLLEEHVLGLFSYLFIEYLSPCTRLVTYL